MRDELELLKSGAMRGDFARRPGQRGLSQTEQRMIRAITVQRMSPEKRALYEKQQAEAKRADAAARALFNVFNMKPDFLKKDGPYSKNIEKLRALSLDDANPDQWLLFYRAVPMIKSRNKIQGKFRFNWGPQGQKIYVPYTKQSWENFYRHPQRGRWLPNVPFMHKCGPEWETHWINKYFAESENARKHFRNTDPRHVWEFRIGTALCKKKKKSLWVKIRKPLAIVAGVVAAVYLGPIVVNKIGAIAGGSGGAAGGAGGAAGAAGGAAGSAAGSAAATAATTAADAAAKASFFSKVKAGSTKILSLVNKARTVEAVVKGELPPPPIGIPGASFREWALIVAKEKIKEEAIDYAAEKGMEYVAKKMSEKEEAKLKAEIAAMQAELIRLTPKEIIEAPPEPSPELATPLKKVQIIETERKSQLDQFIIPGAIVAGALLLGG